MDLKKKKRESKETSNIQSATTYMQNPNLHSLCICKETFILFVNADFNGRYATTDEQIFVSFYGRIDKYH
jgi:hypothetical protein